MNIKIDRVTSSKLSHPNVRLLQDLSGRNVGMSIIPEDGSWALAVSEDGTPTLAITVSILMLDGTTQEMMVDVRDVPRFMTTEQAMKATTIREVSASDEGIVVVRNGVEFETNSHLLHEDDMLFAWGPDPEWPSTHERNDVAGELLDQVVVDEQH